MNQDFSFRMMQGKSGRSGHIKKEGQQLSLSFRHLPPSIPCTLYRDGHVIDTQSSSPQGILQFTCRQDGFFFLCHEHTLLLWEAGDISNYFRAQKMMPRPEAASSSLPAKKTKLPDPPETTPMQDTAEKPPSITPETALPHTQVSYTAPENHEMPVSPVQPETEACTLSSAAPDEAQHLSEEYSFDPMNTDNTPQLAQLPPEENDASILPQSHHLSSAAPTALPDPVHKTVPISSEEPQPEFLPPPDLNPRSAAPSVMTLPPLQWPPALAHLQAVFTNGTPYRPFWQPEFRCVKVPTKNPALPYSIMGYQLKDGQVCALLQAVPGHPLIPPRGFEGAPYRDGHFIRIQPLPPA